MEFKLYITTKMPNPHYIPEIVIKVTLINFTVTPYGLEDQLLVDVIKSERPELEEQKDTLIVQISDYNKQLLDLQDKILKQINEIQGSILDNEEIIITLEASKSTSVTIKKGVKEAGETAEIIDKTREEYRPVATRGSILYFVVADLALIDPMYQYSLEFFIALFNIRLEKSEKSDDVNRRIEILIDDLTVSFYRNICRGLFEKHKLLYSFMIASQIAISKKKISPKEWTYFTIGSYGELKESFEGKPDYLNDQTWMLVKNMELLGFNFDPLPKSFIDGKDTETWKAILESDDPQKLPLPESVHHSDLTPFQVLLIYYTIRKEKLIFFVKDFVKNFLGPVFIESPPFDLRASYEDSTAYTPIIFVLSPGADPMSQLLSFAKEKEMDGSRFKILSLGQGQQSKAEELIKMGRINGDWVCLQNCHLLTSWMTDLERIQESQGDVLEDYRLLLTSMPTNKFPVSVLQSGIKITNEPPKGIKSNIKRTFLEVREDFYNKSSKPNELQRLFFSLSLFHAVILERRKFGAIGWNIPYDWMNSDLETCQIQLKMYLEEQPEVPYETLNYLVAIINYGGRVTDNKDERLISAILSKYFTPDAMLDKYSFSESGVYHIPEKLELSEVMNYIDTLPLDDDPEIFGLHSNANITFQINLMKEFMDTLLIAQPRGQSAGKAGETPEQYVYKIAEDYLNKIPMPLVFSVDPNTASTYHIFRAQELDRFNVLIKKMRKTLDDLKLAINGFVVMSLELENMFDSFIIKKIPTNWENVAYPSLKPLGSWFTDMLERIQFMGQWLEKGEMPSYWTSCFYFPQGFMTAVLQFYARKTEIAIDKLVFKTTVLKQDAKEIKSGPVDGVNIHGMYLQGCSWNIERELLDESIRKKLFQYMPSIWIKPTILTDYDSSNTYPWPVYKTSLRRGELSTTGHSTNFILFLDIPTDVEPDHWIRRGVAMLLQTDD